MPCQGTAASASRNDTSPNCANGRALRNVDLVQVHFITWAIEVGLPLARLLNHPCVVTAHTAVEDFPTDSLEFVQREADAVVVVSDGDLRAWAARTGSDAKLHRVWNGIPLTGHERKPDDAPTGRIKLITAGRLEPSKRIADIIEGVHRLRIAGIDCELQIFGQGPLHEELAATIHRYRLQDHPLTVQGGARIIRYGLLSKYASASLLPMQSSHKVIPWKP